MSRPLFERKANRHRKDTIALLLHLYPPSLYPPRLKDHSTGNYPAPRSSKVSYGGWVTETIFRMRFMAGQPPKNGVEDVLANRRREAVIWMPLDMDVLLNQIQSRRFRSGSRPPHYKEYP